jgi:hypothetical protein
MSIPSMNPTVSSARYPRRGGPGLRRRAAARRPPREALAGGREADLHAALKYLDAKFFLELADLAG